MLLKISLRAKKTIQSLKPEGISPPPLGILPNAGTWYTIGSLTNWRIAEIDDRHISDPKSKSMTSLLWQSQDEWLAKIWEKSAINTLWIWCKCFAERKIFWLFFYHNEITWKNHYSSPNFYNGKTKEKKIKRFALYCSSPDFTNYRWKHMILVIPINLQLSSLQ